ncbi:hypothetical protein quinque_008727 [Culex quinquefasciatus]
MILLQRNGAARGATIGCSATLDDAPDAQCCSSLDTVVLLLSRRLSVVLAGFRRQLDIYPRGAVNLVHALSDDGRRQVGVLLSALSAGSAGRRAKGSMPVRVDRADVKFVKQKYSHLENDTDDVVDYIKINSNGTKVFRRANQNKRFSVTAIEGMYRSI